MRKLIVAVLVMSLLVGCAPIIGGALIMKSSKTKGQRQEFMSSLQRTNTDRESRGLEPLTWCGEAYRFDRGWAMEDPECAARVLAYEAGNRDAFDPAWVVPDSLIEEAVEVRMDERTMDWQGDGI